MGNIALQRLTQLSLTNHSSGTVSQGDVVIVDTANSNSFTTTSTQAFLNGTLGVVLEPNGISTGTAGMVAIAGPVPQINLGTGTASLGDLFYASPIARQALRHASPIQAGDFGQVLAAGSNPPAILWGLPAGATGAGTGNVSGPGSSTAGHLSTFADTTGKVLQDGGAVPVVGNAPDNKPTVNAPAASPTTNDDEFNDGSGMSGPNNGLNARWSKHNMGTAGWSVLSDTKAPGCFMFDIPTAQSVDQAIYQAVPAGDFEVCARVSLATMSNSDRQMWGLFIVDTSGNGVGSVLDDPSGDALTRLRTISSWQQSTAITSVTALANTPWVTGQPIYISLRKASGVYYTSVWLNDRELPAAKTEVNGTPTVFTAAYVGFGRLFGSGTSRVLIDWFRRTA